MVLPQKIIDLAIAAFLSLFDLVGISVLLPLVTTALCNEVTEMPLLSFSC